MPGVPGYREELEFERELGGVAYESEGVYNAGRAAAHYDIR